MRQRGYRLLPIPDGPVTLESGVVLERLPHDLSLTAGGPAMLLLVPRGQGLAVFESTDPPLRVFVSHTTERASGLHLLHLSCNFFGREPSWREIKALRHAFFPPDVDVIQVLPRVDRYVNLHPWVWHLWQFPGEWDPAAV